MVGFTNDKYKPGEFGSTGFGMAYFEENFLTPGGWESANQVRHAVGGLIVGYIRGEDNGLKRMNDREDPNDKKHGVPDINLYNQTVRYGAKIANPMTGHSFAKDLANWIRETLCQQYGQ
jgi:hypothetical protein